MTELQELLRRPAVVAAVTELGVPSLGVEDVLSALRRFGAVRVDVRDDPVRPYACLVDDSEIGFGSTVLHAALACWASVLEDLGDYTRCGQRELERFLLGEGDLA
jgi:hypothetical protein